MQGKTILEAGRRSAFRFSIEGGMDDRDLAEIGSMDPVLCTEPDWHRSVMDSIDLRHRLAYMRHRHLGFGLIGCCDPSFSDELRGIDPVLPDVLGRMVAERYLSGTARLDDLSENMERSIPRGSMPRAWCTDLISRLLAHLGSDAAPDRAVLTVAPAGLEGSFEIEKVGKGYETVLLFGISEDRRGPDHGLNHLNERYSFSSPTRQNRISLRTPPDSLTILEISGQTAVMDAGTAWTR